MFDWLQRLDRRLPVRYSVWLACAVGFLLSAFSWVMFGGGGGGLALMFMVLVGLGVRDTQ